MGRIDLIDVRRDEDDSSVDSPLTARTAGDSIVRRATVECIAVVGNRQGADLSQVLDFIVALHARQPNSLLVSGGADGVDAFAESTWFRLGGRIRSFRPAPYADGFGVEVWNYGGKQPAEVLSVEHHGVQADDYRSAALYRDTLIAEGCDRLVAFYRAGLVWNTGTHFTESWARDRGVPTYSFVAAAEGNTDVA